MNLTRRRVAHAQTSTSRLFQTLILLGFSKRSGDWHGHCKGGTERDDGRLSRRGLAVPACFPYSSHTACITVQGKSPTVEDIRMKKLLLVAVSTAALILGTTSAMAQCDDGEMVIKSSHVVAASGHPKG